MKRTAFIIPSLTGGGAERVVSIWTSELSMLSEDVYLIVFYKTENEYATYGNIKPVYLAENYAEHSKRNFSQKVKLLKATLKKLKISVAIPFVTYAGLLTTLACAGTKIKVVETIRIEPKISPADKKMKIARNLSVFLAKKCIVQNVLQRDYFPKFMHGKMFVQPNPVHGDFFKVKPSKPQNDKIVFVTAGRLETQKRHQMLCDVFKKASAKHDNVFLEIYGEGYLAQKLEEHIKNIGMEQKIKLCGRSTDMVQTLQNSNAFVLASDFEGMPNALMEAMAAGLPCISTDCPTGPSDIITSGKNGLLVPVADMQEMEKAICRFIDNYDEAFDMGAEAKKTMQEKFSASSNARTLFDFIEKL